MSKPCLHCSTNNEYVNTFIWTVTQILCFKRAKSLLRMLLGETAKFLEA